MSPNTLSLSALLLTCGALLLGADTQPRITAPAAIGDHMVFPADRAVTIRGIAAPDAVVNCSLAAHKRQVNADQNGQWTLVLGPLPAAKTASELTVSANGLTTRYTDVVVGDVWLCSGQSNMAMPIAATKAEKAAAAKAVRDVDVRQFNGRVWTKVSPKNVVKQSAVGTWFAMEHASQQDLPVGIFVAAQGGTSIEAWLPPSAFPDSEHGRRMARLAADPAVKKAHAEDARDPKPYGQHRLAKWGLARAAPASLFRQHIEPRGTLPITGAIWYQGESNALSNDPSASEYGTWLKGLVRSWRELFRDPSLPLIVIQLPEYDPRTEAATKGWTKDGDRAHVAWALIQQAQSSVAKDVDGVHLVSTQGLGVLDDIHPRKKMAVGKGAAAAIGKAQPQ